jgi:hypothetical protein
MVSQSISRVPRHLLKRGVNEIGKLDLIERSKNISIIICEVRSKAPSLQCGDLSPLPAPEMKALTSQRTPKKYL